MITKKVDPIFKELAAKVGKPNSETVPFLLAKLVNLEQAKILMELSASAETIAKKLNVEKSLIDNNMQELQEKGLVFPGKSGWHMTRSWGSLHDSAGSANIDKYPQNLDDEFFDLFQIATKEDKEQRVEDAVTGKAPLRQSMRVVPRWKAIKDIPGVLPYEDIREILKKSDPIVLIPCACKRAEPHRECKDTIPVVSCITCGRAGQYNLTRGAGKKLTYEEVMKLFDSLDQFQLIHLTGNANTMPVLVCNCHNCCCGQFIVNAMAKKRGIKQTAFAKSRFVAVVDPHKCRGCKICVDKRCPVGAAQMKYYPELGKERSFVDEEACIGCGLCVITCPNQARKMKIVRPPEHIPAPGAIAGISDGTAA